ncbi:MAG: hypothetical protein ACI9QL_000233 [Candidatus Omnitrophota bacterium]|jgi:hypothetical protein
MRTIRYLGRLSNEFFGYAWQNNAWQNNAWQNNAWQNNAWQNNAWRLIPLVIVLVAFSMLMGVAQTTLPFIYSFF